MAQPLRPELSRSSSRSSNYLDVADDRIAHQAGRSATNLAAQATAQSIREASRPNSRPSSRSSSQAAPRQLLKKSRPGSTTNVASIPEATSPTSSPLPFLPAAASSGLPVPRLPAGRTHAHSNAPSSTDSSSSGRLSNDAAASPRGSTGSMPPSRTATAAGLALAEQMGISTPPGAQTPTQRMPLLSHDTARNDASFHLSRQTTPRTVRDLGSDYTRYYNPFASRNNSRNNSHQDLPRYMNPSASTLLPSAGSVSSADLERRFSNPFGDTKRHSNPYDSNYNTAPGTPLRQQISAEKEKPAVNAMPVGSETIPGLRTGIVTPSFIHDADPEKATFFPYMDDRLGAPDYSFPLFTDEKEDDDDMHMPQWDDDIKLKPKFKDHFTRENIVSTFGLVFMLLGLFCVFVVLPVISYTGTGLIPYSYETPLDQMPNFDGTQPWATVNDRKYPLMTNMRSTLIDPDTPKSAKTKKGIDGDDYVLVFSDEFNQKNRTFYPGDDPYWFGFDGWYGATGDLEWYDPDALNTGDGVLYLTLDKFPNHNLDFRSGMMNSWNQLCFKGGIYEVSMSLPGPGGAHGLWPGAWTMGNLGRPGYLATTDGMWPYTYNECDQGITPNQSMTDGTNHLPGQRLASCTCSGEDHPTPGTGRGAPEIDIAEVSGDYAGLHFGVATQSFQVAPFDIWYYPNYEFMELPDYTLSTVNTYTGGPFQQAISATTILNNNWYDGKEYQTFSFEYTPGSSRDSGITWKVADEEMMRFDARAIGPNGNIGQRLISEEPMSMIINLGISHNWVDIEWQDLVFPATMRVDYVRWYQKEGEEMVTCDPPGYETTEYIRNHPAAYNNPNYTKWDDAGYSWPKNTLMNGCSA
ncbi:Hypothetical protein R9X50_00043300 [Acrodontium crateriforme]|uniref:GH16 domain-containing protein n=1 Tax=Acrodontium crateriforme TaxID=150365 RepID=A0AAQ3LXG9_9PEZI|nr:Hypothetical protein R9X50_00043300 [Acrodontium crateriforme]